MLAISTTIGNLLEEKENQAPPFLGGMHKNILPIYKYKFSVLNTSQSLLLIERSYEVKMHH